MVPGYRIYGAGSDDRVHFTPNAVASPGSLVAPSASAPVIANDTTSVVGSSTATPSSHGITHERDGEDHRLVQQEERHRGGAERPRQRGAEPPHAHPEREAANAHAHDCR